MQIVLSVSNQDANILPGNFPDSPFFQHSTFLSSEVYFQQPYTKNFTYIPIP